MFIDELIRDEFKELGFIKMPLLNSEDILEIQKIYKETSSLCELDKPFYTSIWSDNVTYKENVDKKLKALLMPKLERYLEDFKSVFANFMVKRSGNNSSLPPHQDWSFINEEEADSVTIWIPLIDVDEKNGAMQVCPKSNQLKNYKRPRFQNSPFNSDLNYISENLMKSIPMKKGEALFINSRTIHSSPNNISNTDRIAISIVIIPKKSNIIHYVMAQEENNKAYGLNVEPTFFTKYSCFDYPKLEVNDRLEVLETPPSFKDLLEIVQN